MRLAKYRRPDGTAGVGRLDGDLLMPLPAATLAELLTGPVPEPSGDALPLASVTLLPPVDRQEVWAAGVTYLRSKKAREEESVGAARFYDMVYTAARPELFFKATAERVVGPGQPIRARADSRWSVPEPELALVIAPDLRIVGYTVGNDVSARDIEGENPLYLPQAKLYKQSCALGPCVTLAAAMLPLASVAIRLRIDRGGGTAFAGVTTLAKLARPLEELVDWLGRENAFPNGAVLLTGTGIVPPDEFTLYAGDVVSIAIDGIGELVNPVVVGDAS